MLGNLLGIDLKYNFYKTLVYKNFIIINNGGGTKDTDAARMSQFGSADILQRAFIVVLKIYKNQ